MLSGKALDEFARTLYDNDPNMFNRVIVSLMRSGSMQSYENIAAMLSNVVQSEKSGGSDYFTARYGEPRYKRYVDMFINICASAGCTEEDYMAVLLAAQYGSLSGALYRWDETVNMYISRRAAEDFSLVADYIDKYDKKYAKYAVLAEVDRQKTLVRLLDKAIYEKNVDKTAVRDILMDYGSEITPLLTDLYLRSKAKERLAIARLLLLFKNDVDVREFLAETVKNDSSKTVRAVLDGAKRKRRGSPAEFMENLMIDGRPLLYMEWRELLSDSAYGEVADRVFFCMREFDTGVKRVLVYNDGHFLNMSDRLVKLAPEQPIYVLHPLDVPTHAKSILSMDISQPFLQIARPIYHAVSGEAYSSDRLTGTMISLDDFAYNLKQLGFTVCDKRVDTEPDTVIRRIGGYVVGVEIDVPKNIDTVSCGRLVYYDASDVVKLNRKVYVSATRPLAISDVPRREFSELTYAAYKLFGCV